MESQVHQGSACTRLFVEEARTTLSDRFSGSPLAAQRLVHLNDADATGMDEMKEMLSKVVAESVTSMPKP